MGSIIPKCPRNLSQIFKVPKQHLGPISVHKFDAFKYHFASGLGQQMPSAVATQTSSFFIADPCLSIADHPMSNGNQALERQHSKTQSFQKYAAIAGR